MNVRRIVRSTRGQNTVEYAVLISMVALVILVVQYFIRSAYAGRMRSSADQLSSQYVDPMRPYNLTTRSQGTRRETTNTAGVQRSLVITAPEISTQTASIGTAVESGAAPGDFLDLSGTAE